MRDISLLLQAKQAVVCHPMHFEGSEGREREYEDHDGFFEPWSHQKLGLLSDDKLEITVGFLAVKYPSGIYSYTIMHDRHLNQFVRMSHI